MKRNNFDESDFLTLEDFEKLGNFNIINDFMFFLFGIKLEDSQIYSKLKRETSLQMERMKTIEDRANGNYRKNQSDMDFMKSLYN